MSPAPKKRYRKRTSQPPLLPNVGSERLARISALVDSADYPEALAAIDADLARESSPRRQAKLLGQVARTLHKRGKFAEASEVAARAAALAAEESRDWLAPVMARIRALIKNVSLLDADREARACLAAAEEKHGEFERLRSAAADEFARTGRVVIPRKPHRPSVVASELGEMFLLEGELESARFFFEKAVEGNPRGGTRARQGLAEIALRMDDAQTAFQRSVEALTLGKFQGKTIASWKPFFAARRKLGHAGLSPEFVASLRASRPSVRARAWLAVVRELRSANDAQWATLAQEWLALDASKYPAVAAELRKMLMASTKQAMSDPVAQASAAEQLMNTPELAPHEWLAGAKEFVRSTLFAAGNPGIQRLVAEGVRRYGPAFQGQLLHSLALSCMMAKRHDLARPLLRRAIAATADSRNHFWSKALWALGRMESLLNNTSAAAEAFSQVAAAEQVPQRFRLQARLLWAENLIASGDEDALQACADELPRMLAGVKDFETLLDFARQLSRARGNFRALTDQIYALGERAALQEFSSASHPSQAIDVLFKLTRRQVYDFGKSRAVAAFWETLSDDKKLWLWSNDNRWWGYLAFVIMAYCRTDRLSEAGNLAQTLLGDPAIPRESLPTVLMPYYESLIVQGRAAEALDAFRWMVTENPTKAGCATAYYWLALESHRNRDQSEVLRLCDALLISNAHTEVTLDKWMLDAKARLLQVGLDPRSVTTQAVNYDGEFLQKALSALNADLESFNP
jgi:tetratricopeptide (TPR) repeat protein